MAKSLHQKYGKDAPAVLSGMMRDASERIPLPARFQVKNGTAPNNVNIVDTVTGKVLNVGLCDLRGVRLALGKFCEE